MRTLLALLYSIPARFRDLLRGPPAAFVVALLLAACSTQTAALVAREAPPAARANACAPAVVAPTAPQLAVAAPAGVEFVTGPAEHLQSVLVLPGGWVNCGTTFVADVGYALGKGLTCLGSNLVPTPTPSMRYVYAPLVAAPNACAQGSACALPARTGCGTPQSDPVKPGGGLEPNIPDVRR